MSPLLVVALVFGLANDYVPYDEVESVAQRWAETQWSDMSLARVLTYYSFDGEVNAYAFIFARGNMVPDEILIRQVMDTRGQKPRNRYGVDRYATVVMSAHYSEVPVFQYYRGLPPWYSIRRYMPWELENGRALRVYYYRPMEEWVEFETTSGNVLVDGYSAKVHNKDEFIKTFSFAEVNPRNALIAKGMWLELKNHQIATRDSNKIPDMVPFYEWHYGCSPTASSMLAGYWDARNYAKLTDFFYGPRFSYPENSWDDGIANCQREMALAMNTDTLTGGTSIYSIATGQRNACNGYGNNYNFTSSMHGPGTQSSPYVTWNVVKAEIDAGRPLNWSVLGWGPSSYNHSLTGVGYKTVGSARYVYVNTTWTEGEEWWVQHTSGSRDYAYPLVPGGGVDCDLRLTYPDTRAMMFRKLKYRIKWTSSGSTTIDQLNIYYHTGYNPNTWTTLATGVSNNGSWIWTVPDDTIEARIALRGYDTGSNLAAADGESLAFVTRTYEHSPELVLVGHYDTYGTLEDVFWSNDYLYCADGASGLTIFDVSDSSLPDLVGSLPLPSIVAVEYQGSKHAVYLASDLDTVFSVNVTDPANPSQLGLWPAPDHCYDIKLYQTNYLIAACRSAGIFVLDVSNPSSPNQIGTYDTPGTANGLDIAGNLLYVADGTKGMRIVDLTDPQHPTEIGSYDPIGVAKAVAVRGDRAYLMNGGLGITIIDVSDPQNPSELGTIDTPGTATWAKAVSVTHLFVGDAGSGLRVYNVVDPSNPTEVGYLDSHGEATRMAFNGDLIYLADKGDGIYVIHSDLIGIGEGSSVKLTEITIPSLIRNRLTITGSVPIKTRIRVEIDDIIGRRVTSFATDVSGKFSINHPLSLSAGIYFVRISGAGRVIRSKTVVIK